MASWQGLPPEIRLMVLECILDKTKSKVAAYASVSKEWQAFFERRCFGAMSLTKQDLAAFSRIVGGKNVYRISYIHVLRLYISLDEYDCLECREEETPATIRKIDFTMALRSLMSTLSAWKASYSKDAHDRIGLVLELGAYSPSDSLHTFQDFRLRHPFYPVRECEHEPLYRLHTQRQGKSSTNRSHALRRGIYTDIPAPGAARRVLGGQPLRLHFGQMPGRKYATFPTVDIVRTLRLRRRFYRMVGPSVLHRLCASCPRMVELCSEYWRPVDKKVFDTVEHDIGYFLFNGLPASVRRLSFFQDANNWMHPYRDALTSQIPSGKLGATLARASAQREEVAASFVVDAANFVASVNVEHIVFPHLTHLALTSTCLDPLEEPWKARHLLKWAAAAVAYMPKLQVLELWYATLTFGRVFRFTTQPPAIYLGSSWHTDHRRLLWPSIVGKWQAAVDTHASSSSSGRPLTIQHERFPKNADGRLCAMQALQLRSLILDPDSFYEMEQERLEFLPYLLTVH